MKINKNNKQINLQYIIQCIAFAVMINLIFSNCQTKSTEPKLFKKLSATETGIDFKNEIIENDTHNILNFTNLYTGSGVGIGDFNNDGLQDIFFGGNMESSRLYLNKTNLQFEDITEKANIKTNRWVTGVSVIDINNDGWEDIYLCVSGNATAEKRKNLLFINNQNNTFTEQAEKYGIADTAQCTHANFFDYDKDGDLDLFVIVNPTNYKLFNVNNIRKKKINGESESTDKLYQNNGDGTFTDVSTKAGILIEGYSLSLNVSDLNNDGWSDIYVTNDFMTNDIIYINNQNGTFTNRAAEMLKHTSFASMGIDVADINNDGLPEIYVLDMLPEDNYRQKMIAGSDNYDRFQYMIKTGYEPQYSRNTLQLNNGDGTFSEIGQMANVHKTDWSWSALLADYDNDGFRDLFVTNGFRRDLGDLDYINYTNTNPFGNPETRKKNQLKRILEQPGAKLPNYIFKNENGLTFSKKSTNWGVDEPSYSHGAAYADLDNDGDLDLVVNNVSQTAFIYENQANTLLKNNFLKMNLNVKASDAFKASDASNALGTKVTIYYNNQIQYAELTPYKGYQSTVEKTLHFGLGKVEKIDSVKVVWANGQSTIIENTKVNQTINISPKDGKRSSVGRFKSVRHFTTLPASLFDFTHQEDIQIDFNTQALLPHQHSKSGPCMAVADVNNDGLEDVFIGGAAGFSGTFFIQNKIDDEKGQTLSKRPPLDAPNFTKIKLNQDVEKEDTDCLFFDADNDGDLDLYVVSGGVVYSNKKDIYQDRIYINNNGVFTKNKSILPTINSSGSCVIAMDFDNDGDQDLFIGGRVTPTKYPTIPNSYLLENVNHKFKDITPKSLKNIGMVTDAIWSDFDNDKDEDLIIVGEFMPITIFENQNGEINNSKFVIRNSSGWWNCVEQGDFDNDGDIDFLAGNLGLNTNFRASTKQPVCLYANDFDKNGSLDPVLCQYLENVEVPTVSRDKLIKQIPPIKNRFTNYKTYAKANFSDIFKRPERKNMQVLEAQLLESCYIENQGNGQFKIHILPLELQVSPLNDFLVEDINNDGNLDALVIGNSYATEVGQGRYDAFTGAIMWGNGHGKFDIKRGADCGFKADKDAKSLIKIQFEKNKKTYLVGNNSAKLQGFQARNF